jgi:hypothetical protein
MAYTARQVITKAYYLSGIYARRLETVDGADMTLGLELLNDLLGDKTADYSLIPFYKKYTFNTIAQTASYFIDSLLDIETETFNIGLTRFSTKRLSRKQFFDVPQSDNVYSLPQTWHPERSLNGTTIYFYPVPDAVYSITLFGKFALSEVPTFETDISLVYEKVYRNYIAYKLAQIICDENQLSLADPIMRQLAEYERKLEYQSPIDLTMRKISTLSSGYSGVELPNPLWNGWLP